MQRTLTIDHLNSLLIVIACLLAYVLPFDLLIFSYAILGPAHYLTEISWLHDRKYFLKNHLDILLLAIAGLAMFFFIGLYPVLIGFLVCFLFLSTRSVRPLHKWLLTGIYGLPLLAFSITPGMIAIIALLPTLIHVYLFTAGFMLLGALKNNNSAGIWSFILLMICGVSFFLPFIQPFAYASSYTTGINYALANIYSSPINLLNLTETEDLVRRFAGFASFAYTYHYLNWFTKTKVIKWNQISPARLYFIGSLYLFSVGVYFYNYILGLQLLFFLSFIHVILELPLNALCFTEISRLIKVRYKA
jgi:hypothetical protein